MYPKPRKLVLFVTIRAYRDLPKPLAAQQNGPRLWHYESAGLTVSLDASTGDKPTILANVAQKVAVTSVPPRRTASMALEPRCQ
jgi:hypothetical protein